MTYSPVLALSSADACNRARRIAQVKSKYILGAGGRNPGADTPFTIRDKQLGSDCIGFVLWCLGLDRYQPVDGVAIEYPFYEGWINTDSMLMDVEKDQVEFEATHYPFPGCAVVYPSVWKDGKMIRMGHIALVVETPLTWPNPKEWARLSTKERADWMAQVTCIDCAGAFKRKLTGYAVALRDATPWNKPDAKFVAWKRQTKSTAYPREAPAPTPTMAQPKLGARLLKLDKPLMRGQDVADLQKLLGLSPDGVFGPETESFVRQFQRKNKLFEDGVVGPATLTKLKP
jgi:hypothetical protein